MTLIKTSHILVLNFIPGYYLRHHRVRLIFCTSYSSLIHCFLSSHPFTFTSFSSFVLVPFFISLHFLYLCYLIILIIYHYLITVVFLSSFPNWRLYQMIFGALSVSVSHYLYHIVLFFRISGYLPRVIFISATSLPHYIVYFVMILHLYLMLLLTLSWLYILTSSSIYFITTLQPHIIIFFASFFFGVILSLLFSLSHLLNSSISLPHHYKC